MNKGIRSHTKYVSMTAFREIVFVYRMDVLGRSDRYHGHTTTAKTASHKLCAMSRTSNVLYTSALTRFTWAAGMSPVGKALPLRPKLM